MEKILLVIMAVLLIAAAHDLAPRVRVAPALVLVVIGAVIGLMPFVPTVEIDPEWILVGVLPPLLYAAAVSMPTMDFRRDFGAISALSVLLVLISAVALGFFFHWVIPGIDLATGIALGAIVSPTDAVATSIAKKMGAPARVTAVLEGESMLNDASALVLLRAAVAAMASTVSFGGVALDFAYSVVVAVILGVVVGALTLAIRSRITNAAANTAISFTVPYLAYLPAEELGASGLVAAVTAGLIVGAGAVRYLSPQHRFSDAQNWRTVELILEGGVFLLMGLELWGLLVEVHEHHEGIMRAVWLGFAALGVTVLIRTVYVATLIWWLDRRRRRGDELRPILAGLSAKPDATVGTESWLRRRISRWRWRLEQRRGRIADLPPAASPETAGRINSRIMRTLADIDYYADTPLGPKEGTIIVWAGLRGVVTVAAAQTLPDTTHSRALLVLTAFIVAAASLLVQGGTLPWLIRTLNLADRSAVLTAERRRLRAELDATAQEVMAASDEVKRVPWLRPRLEQANRDAEEADEADEKPVGGAGTPYGLSFEERVAIRKVRRAIIEAQRRKLLRMRRHGTYSSAALARALGQLDAEEISLDLQAGT